MTNDELSQWNVSSEPERMNCLSVHPDKLIVKKYPLLLEVVVKTKVIILLDAAAQASLPTTLNSFLSRAQTFSLEKTDF